MPTGSGTVSFPGLGLHNMRISRVALSLFGMDIYWYGVIIAVGFFLALLLAVRLGEQRGISSDDIVNIAIITAPISIAGARAYYVATTWGDYHSFIEVIAFWNGGIAIYGCILAGLASLLILARVKRIPRMRLLDCAAPPVLLGQAVGRWGNFVNQEAFGVTTTLPWRMSLIVNGVVMEVHPTFLYESLWGFLGLALLLRAFRRHRYDGEVFWSYMGWYGFGRSLIEGLRTDSLFVGPYRISQVLGAAIFILSAVVLVFMNGRSGSKRAA